jgi:hypothetical protein
MMRSGHNRKPHWNTLGLIVLLAIGGLIVGHGLHLTPMDHKITMLLIIAVTYGLIGLWLKANAAALEELDAEECRNRSHDPAVYGTREFPTRTQAHFQQTVSLYHHASPDKREKL